MENSSEFFTVNRIDSWNRWDIIFIQGVYTSQRSAQKFSVFYTVTGLITVSALYSDPIFWFTGYFV